MSKRSVGLVVVGVVVGLLAGVGGLHFAQSRGLLPERVVRERVHPANEHDHESAANRHDLELAERADDEHDHADDRRDEHAETDQHGEESIVRFSDEEGRKFGVQVAIAAFGKLITQIRLPGEIVLDADRVAHIVPRVGGLVRDVIKSLGDEVQPGEVMAVLESRELSEAKAMYLAVKQRLSLAQSNLAAYEELQSKGIVADLEFLATQRELAEAEIAQRAAEFKLHALGLTEEEMSDIEKQYDAAFAIYELRAPFAGTIIERHITLGEVVTPESNVFILADLSSVWVDIAVYQKDLAYVKEGMNVSISAGVAMPNARGMIGYVAPVVDEKTRTALARVVLPNPDGEWRPGLFVNAEIAVGEKSTSVVVPKTAIQRMGEQTVVFLEASEGFRPVPVSIGRSNATHVEVLSGLTAGQRYVVQGAFELKARITTSGLGAHAGHGH